MLAACGQAGEESGSWGEEESQAVLGCMDPVASNYDPLATVQDGSCHYMSHWGMGALNETLLANAELGHLIEAVHTLSMGANRSAANASSGNVSSTASGRTTVWAVDAATPEPSGLAWYRVAELILLGVFAAALGLGLLWHLSTVGGWLEKALMEVESHSQYVVGKSSEGLVLTIRATQDVVTVATTATPQDVAALGKAAGASVVVGTPRTLKQMKQNVAMGWSRDSGGSAADDAQSDALEAPSSPSSDESGSDGGSSPTSRSRSRSASPRGMQRVSVRGAGDAMNAGLSRAEKAVLSGQKLTSQAIGTGLEGGKGVLAEVGRGSEVVDRVLQKELVRKVSANSASSHWPERS